jgi:hypothetical protein
MVLISELTQLIYADNILSDHEAAAFDIIGQELKIAKDEMNAIMVFIAGEKLADFDSSSILIISNKGDEVPRQMLLFRSAG